MRPPPFQPERPAARFSAEALLAETDRPGEGPIAADMAFCELAQSSGEWTALRTVSLPLSEIFVPERVKVLEYGADQPDPPVPTRWKPEQAWVSADSSIAVTFGQWWLPGVRERGWYEAVWAKLRDGSYRVLLRSAGSEARKLHSRPGLRGQRAASGGLPVLPTIAPAAGADHKLEHSHDQTLIWTSSVGNEGDLSIAVWLWDGEQHQLVMESVAPALPPR
ncbi:MAG: hypothetical protein RL299_858 [Pseudomonadota bacterium]